MEEIYAGPAANQIFYLKVISLTSSVMALAFQAAVFMRIEELGLLQTAGWSTAFTLTFITPALAHFLFRKYVINLYYDEENDTYVAVVYSLPGAKQRVRIWYFRF